MKKWILTLIFVLPLVGWAQSDFDEGSDDFAEDVSDSSEDSAQEDIKDELKEEKLEESKPTDAAVLSNKEEVTDKDYARLSEARKSRSESALVKAAAEILGKDAQNKQALNAMAVFYFENKKYGLAKIILKRALKDHANEPALHNNLGIIYLAEGDIRLALESFKKSVQEKSSYRIGATNLSSIYLEYRDYKRSLSPLEDGYRATKSDLRRGQGYAVEIANNYALALMGVGENDKAEDIFSDIAESDSRNPIPLLNYATLLVEVLKKKKDAIRVISKLKFMTEDREVLRRVEEIERKME